MICGRKLMLKKIILPAYLLSGLPRSRTWGWAWDLARRGARPAGSWGPWSRDRAAWTPAQASTDTIIQVQYNVHEQFKIKTCQNVPRHREEQKHLEGKSAFIVFKTGTFCWPFFGSRQCPCAYIIWFNKGGMEFGNMKYVCRFVFVFFNL